MAEGFTERQCSGMALSAGSGLGGMQIADKSREKSGRHKRAAILGAGMKASIEWHSGDRMPPKNEKTAPLAVERQLSEN